MESQPAVDYWDGVEGGMGWGGGQFASRVLTSGHRDRQWHRLRQAQAQTDTGTDRHRLRQAQAQTDIGT